RQCLPLALEDGQGRGMERVASFEARLQELAGLLLGGGRIHRGPLRWKLRASLEAPVGILPGDVLPHALVAEIFEQPAADDLADLGFVVRDELLGDAPDLLRDEVLP